jgi:hypothetical protein
MTTVDEAVAKVLELVEERDHVSFAEPRSAQAIIRDALETPECARRTS